MVGRLLSAISLLLLLLSGCGDSEPDRAPSSARDELIEEARVQEPTKSDEQTRLDAIDDLEASQLWDRVYAGRHQLYEQHFGPLPEDILKMANLFGVWPGGGLFEYQSERLDGIWVYASFGLTNPDMPATVAVQDLEQQTDEHGRLKSSASRLVKKQSPPQARGRTGYGYELILLTREKSDWALGLLQWAINAELLHGAGLLDRVEKYAGLTVEDVPVDDGQPTHILIAPAQPPLPPVLELPNGPIRLLVITAITPDEMKYSFEHGRDKLLELLMQSEVGQRSGRSRVSVVPQIAIE